jgi:spermidine/putrescine transport system permease protein
MAYFLSQQKGKRKGLFVVLMFIPFWTSYVVRTFAWLPILGRTGLINYFLLRLGIVQKPIEWLLYNEFAVYVGLLYVYLLFMTLPIYLSLERIDKRLIEAAVDLGARPRNVFWRIILPLSWPGVMSGSIMVFLMGFGVFVTPTILGGPSGIMIGNAVADQFTAASNWTFGALLSILMMAVVFGVILVSRRWVGIQQVFLRAD